MAPHEKALFAVFGLQFFLGDRKSAVSLMNNLNLSCRLKSKRDQGRFSTPVYSLARNAFIRVIKTEGAQQWLRQHRYRRINDIGRELWLSMDDLTRHVMFFATTGGGKTETTFAWLLNPLCWGRGFTFVDGKAQNDTTRTIWYLSRRFGREDDIEVINFMNGGKSRSEVIQSGDKSRPQSNTWNPFAFSTEAFTAETMQSMLPQNVQGGEWQSRAIAMNKALVFGTKFWCVREGKTMSLQMLREHMTLEGMALMTSGRKKLSHHCETTCRMSRDSICHW